MQDSTAANKRDTQPALTARLAELERAHERKIQMLNRAQVEWQRQTDKDQEWHSIPQELFTYAQSEFLSYYVYVEDGAYKAVDHFLPGLKEHYMKLARN